jgi:hypothetical protein
MKSQREHAAETLFRKVKAAIIRRRGRGPLSDTVIDEEGGALFGARWGGVHDQNTTLQPGKYYVINTSYSPKSPGVHWVAVVVSKAGVVHMYDSYARNGAHLLSTLARRIRKSGGSGRSFVESETSDREQMNGSAVCGHLSLAFLVVVRDLGLREALLI